MRLKEHNRDRSRISTDVENGDSGPGSIFYQVSELKNASSWKRKTHRAAESIIGYLGWKLIPKYN